MEGISSFIQMIVSFWSVVWALVKPPVLYICEKLSRVFLWYKKLWIRFTHNKYDEFVYKKGVAMAATTLVAIIVIPNIILIFSQSVYYLATYRKETLYLIQSEEIFPEDNIWGIRGCYTQNCDSDSSVYFRIKPSAFHHLWSVSHNGTLFLPDIIGSSVPTGLTRCEVTSYGVRTRVLMTFHVYPLALKIMCEGYGDLRQ